MPELTLYNIDQISRDVQGQEITFSHLPDELIDHLCCDVEKEMLKGIDFSDAYKRVKQKMGSRRLKEIQEETLYIVDTKYRKMKNTMKISGITGTVLLAFASLFKVMHWPGASIMMVLGAVTLAFVFMPSALGVLWKETRSSKRLFLFISAFFATTFFIMGILFKVQHWPMSGFVLTLGGISTILFFIPTLLYSSLKGQENNYKKTIYILGATGVMLYIAGFIFKMQHWPLAGVLMICGLIVLFVIVFPWYTKITWGNESFIKAEFIFLVVGSLAVIIPAALVMTNVQRSYDQGYYINHGQEQAMYIYLNENNQTYIESSRDSVYYPAMQQLHSRTGELIALINSIESKMIGLAEGKPGMPVANPDEIIVSENGPVIRFEFISNPFHIVPVQEYLFPGTASRKELEAAISDYKTYLSGISSPDKLQIISRILDPSTCLPDQSQDKKKISMLSGLHSLALMKNNLLTAESFALENLTQKQ